MRERIIAELRALGAKRVTVSYSGGGDSGQIDDVVIDGDPENNSYLAVEEDQDFLVEGQGFVTKSATVNKKLTDVIRDFCDTIIDDDYSGCFNDDGADGCFELDVEAGTMVMTHNEHYMASNTTTTVVEMSTPLSDLRDSTLEREGE